MVDIGSHKQEIARTKEAMAKSKSPYLKRDMMKHLKRLERELRIANKYLKEA